MLRLILFVLPLGLDTFAVSSALGMLQPPKRDRYDSDYIAIAVLASLGVWMLVHEDENEGAKAAQLASGSGLMLLAIGVSISLDELAMGFTVSLLHLSIWLAVVLIGAQAFILAQLGLRLGTRISQNARENTGRLAGIALIGLAALLAFEKLS